MSKVTTTNIEITDNLDDLVKRFYTNYGEYVNLNRHIPNFYDGLKPVYRKAIYAAMKTAGKGITKVASILGEAVKYYPHNPSYIEPVINSLAIFGIFVDEGNNGMAKLYMKDTEAAAARYLDSGVQPFYYDLFNKLIPYVPYTESELGFSEPQYIPTPIPLGLTFGTVGISCGCNTDIPPFTPKSLMEAYLADDPSKLEMSYGLQLLHQESNLDGIWNLGAGKLVYQYRISEERDVKGRLVIKVQGNPTYDSPNWDLIQDDYEFNLRELEKMGKVSIIETRENNLATLYIVNNPNKGVSDDELARYVKARCTRTKLVKLTVYKGNEVGRVSAKYWIGSTLDNYIELLSKYVDSNIAKLERERAILEALPTVTKVLLNHRDWSNEQIATEAEVEKWIVDEVMKKPISSLKKDKDFTNRIAAIDNQLDELRNFNSAKFTVDSVLAIPGI